MQYKILSASWSERLEDEVNRYLAMGWKLSGGVSASSQGFFQAITKD